MIRKPCVSGLFYESNKELLIKNIENLFSNVNTPYELDEISAAIVPHAGYIYSGKTASYAFSSILKNDLPDTFIIIGPNHTSYGTMIDVCEYEKWETPLGNVDIDHEFINMLMEIDPNVVLDNNAHIKEHSIEVELPFIQYICQDHEFKIVPIITSNQNPDLCKKLAYSLDKVIHELNRKCIILASTDLTHYENEDIANYLDDKIIKSVESMYMDRMINDIIEYDITMCGYGPVITAVTYSKLQNNDKSIVLNHTTSGEVSGDYESVVGYMSAIIGK